MSRRELWARVADTLWQVTDVGTPGDCGDQREHGDQPAQMRVRLAKLERLRASGVDPYPAGFARTTTIGALQEKYRDLGPGAATGEGVGVTGRVILNRISGKLSFATIRDGTGDLQIMLSFDRLGKDALAAWKRDVDLGDQVGVAGEVVTSRRGELSVLAERFAITSKCLRPLPEKHKGLTDIESRVRRRYLDLIVNPAARRMVEIRSTAVRVVREQMTARGFIEVETPMLQRVHGGANARPFVTHHNAYNLDLYLRIAPELFLKRLLVGGIEKVFEINRNFRNEGVDSTHNPEFTMLEAYEAYGDYDTVATMTRELIQAAAVAALGGTVIHRPDGAELDIGGVWPSKTVHEAIAEALGEEITPGTDELRLRELCSKAGVPADPKWNRGQIILEMYERLVEEHTVEPTFYRDFPTEVSPLVRAHRDDPRVAERWDLVAVGTELGTGYSELIDPIEERARLTAQSLLAAGGDAEAMQLDEDFLRALEYAMPPSGGMGMGIDRMLMLMTGANIRETILFPLVRPEG